MKKILLLTIYFLFAQSALCQDDFRGVSIFKLGTTFNDLNAKMIAKYQIDMNKHISEYQKDFDDYRNVNKDMSIEVNSRNLVLKLEDLFSSKNFAYTGWHENIASASFGYKDDSTKFTTSVPVWGKVFKCIKIDKQIVLYEGVYLNRIFLLFVDNILTSVFLSAPYTFHEDFEATGILKGKNVVISTLIKHPSGDFPKRDGVCEFSDFYLQYKYYGVAIVYTFKDTVIFENIKKCVEKNINQIKVEIDKEKLQIKQEEEKKKKNINSLIKD